MNVHRTLAMTLRAIGAGLVLVLSSGATCPSPQGAGTPVYDHGIFAESATGPFPQRQRVGCSETITVPISVGLLPGEQPGQMVTVTATVYQGATVSPPSVQLALPAVGARTYTMFRVTTPPTHVLTSMLAERTRSSTATGTNVEEVQVRAEYESLTKLASVTLTPSSSSIVRGGAQVFTASILPRGTTEGHVEFENVLYGFGPEVTVEPATFSADLVRGSTTPVDRTLIVRATSTAGLGQGSLLVNQLGIWSQPALVQKASVRIITGTNPPDFTLTAAPQTFSVQNGVTSIGVIFTLTSVNGFDGDVTIIRSADGEASVVPADNYFPITVRPGAPGRFVRNFIRWFGTDPIHVTFKGHSATVQQDKEVVITLNYAP